MKIDQTKVFENERKQLKAFKRSKKLNKPKRVKLWKREKNRLFG